MSENSQDTFNDTAGGRDSSGSASGQTQAHSVFAARQSELLKKWRNWYDEVLEEWKKNNETTARDSARKQLMKNLLDPADRFTKFDIYKDWFYNIIPEEDSYLLTEEIDHQLKEAWNARPRVY